MATTDGRYVLVYNGEVYNFREIRRELEALGETFSSSGDTEVVLKALVRWGGAAVERFRGMFAFGLWDERERKLLLARDRLGVKPLYLVSGPNGLAFSSEVRTLLAAGAAPRVLSPRGLLGYMRFGSVEEPDTLIAGVLSLAPGALLDYDGNETRERRYWAIPSGPPQPMSRQDAVGGIRALLHEATRLRLVSDVPFGIFLSGGGDSSALAALASEEASSPVHTFTVVFSETDFSEEKWAEDVSGRFGCVHHSVHVTGAEAAEHLPEAFRAQDQPSGDGLNSWLVSRAARRAGLSMALSGLGGDEVFAGYRNFRLFGRLILASRTARAIPPGIASLLERHMARPGAGNTGRKAVAVARAHGRPLEVYGALRRVFTDSQLEFLMPGPAFRRINAGSAPAVSSADMPWAADAGDVVNLFSRFELAYYLRNTLLRDTDAMSMANSLEVRVPFLDHRLLEFLLAVPGEMKIGHGLNKPLLFDAVTTLPREVGRRPKMGFVLPLAEWFHGPMKGEMKEILLGLPGPSAGILRRPATRAVWESFLRGDGITASRLWSLASLSAWVAEHDLILPW